MSTEPMLRLDRVSVAFGALRAVDDVSLQVQAGERLAIIGPNGAGKTTLFNAIAGEIRASSGRVHLDRQDVTHRRPHQRAALGLTRTFQITNLFANLTVEQNVTLAIRGVTARRFSLFSSGRPHADERQTVDGALERAGLAGRGPALTRELSYGEQRQLELALALSVSPRLLLLDEPAAGLSPAERVRMAEAIRALPRSLTLVLIEHDMDLALGLVDRVACLYFGRVLAEGSPSEIRSNQEIQDVYFGKAREHA
ncbi:MAG: ABC transporter ATP-binding protein [Lautropia sp.]